MLRSESNSTIFRLLTPIDTHQSYQIPDIVETLSSFAESACYKSAAESNISLSRMVFTRIALNYIFLCIYFFIYGQIIWGFCVENKAKYKISATYLGHKQFALNYATNWLDRSELRRAFAFAQVYCPVVPVLEKYKKKLNKIYKKCKLQKLSHLKFCVY